MIKLIWAQTKEGVIGKNNQLPWSIPNEMRHFRNTTRNATILMGRKTFSSLDNQPLKNRKNYVLTSDVTKFENFVLPNLHFIDRIDKLITKYQNSKANDLYVIGGNTIFEMFFPYADEIIRTMIYQKYEGDLKITDFDFQDFQLVKSIKETEFEIQYLERKKKNEQAKTRTSKATKH